eukprot:TRINITY_DN8965_c0_g1_i5.p1 TRINITY_DN8965_c0_g1~~TRINITY_DN8965_c0_g1_i5.p1  ORF type:complete len:570 (+),score=197.67 TRINITY_DN8965_c0_g1_i5:99-1712(+)
MSVAAVLADGQQQHPASDADTDSPLILPTSLDETPMLASPVLAPEPVDMKSPSIPALTSPVMPAADGPEPIVREVVTMVVNGLQTVSCDASQREAGVCREGSVALSDRCVRVMPTCAGRTQVHLVVSAQNVLLPRDSALRCRAHLTPAGGGARHTVSFSDVDHRMVSRCVVEQLPFVPAHAALEVEYRASASKGDAEHKVVDILREVIADEQINPRGGSIPASLADEVLQSRAPQLYEAVVQRGGGMEAFLGRHEDVFTYFRFSDRALKKKTVSPEPRIVLKPGQRERCANLPVAPAEMRLHDYLLQILGREDIDKRDLLDLLSNDTGFATFLSPTLSILMRFLSRHKDVFVWSMDPDKPTVVGLQGRQHDSASLGQQASLDKAMAAPPQKRPQPGKVQQAAQPVWPQRFEHRRREPRMTQPRGHVWNRQPEQQPGMQVIEVHQDGQRVVQQPQSLSQLPPHLQQLVGNISPNQQVIIETIYTDQLPPDVAASVGAGGGVVVYEETFAQQPPTQQERVIMQEVRQPHGGFMMHDWAG